MRNTRLKASMYLQYFTFCTLIGLSYALVGRNVRTAGAHEFPFVASISELEPIHHRIYRHICTGSLITKKLVLTAAHCLISRQFNDVVILAGNHSLSNAEKYNVESWITYEEWISGKKDEPSLSDVSIIILHGEGVQLSHVIPVEVLLIDPDTLEGKKVRIAGWGEGENARVVTNLRTAGLTIISNEVCNDRGSALLGSPFSVPPNYFCSLANPPTLTTCGDGGAPILDRQRQVIGINIGVCPVLEGPIYNTRFSNQNQMNSHLRLHFYGHFIRNIRNRHV